MSKKLCPMCGKEWKGNSDKTVKIKFVRDHWLACNDGGGNIFRKDEERIYIYAKECIKIKYKDKYVSYYDFPIEDMHKNCDVVEDNMNDDKDTNVPMTPPPHERATPTEGWEKELRLDLDDLFEEYEYYDGPNSDELFERVLRFSKSFIKETIASERQKCTEELVEKIKAHFLQEWEYGENEIMISKVMEYLASLKERSS